MSSASRVCCSVNGLDACLRLCSGERACRAQRFSQRPRDTPRCVTHPGIMPEDTCRVTRLALCSDALRPRSHDGCDAHWGTQGGRGGEDRPHGWCQRWAHGAVLRSRCGPRIMPPSTGPRPDALRRLPQPIAAMGLDLGCLLRPCHGTSLCPAFPRRRSDYRRATQHTKERRMKRVVAIILGGGAGTRLYPLGSIP
jgi:hypothetical protein